MVTLNSTWELDGSLLKTIVDELHNCSAISRFSLIDRCMGDRAGMDRILSALLAAGEIEVLRPVDAASSASARAACAMRDQTEYYRLVRATDKHFLWQQRVVKVLPQGRMHDIAQIERPGGLEMHWAM